MEPQTYSAFRTWFQERGGYIHDKVSFKKTGIVTRSLSSCILIDINSENAGYAVTATEDLPTDATIATCPFSLVITEELAKRNLSKLFSTANSVEWTDYQWLSTYICLHWILADSKPPELEHYPYIDTLPRSDQLRTSLHFTKVELEAFRGSLLYHATTDRERKWKEQWQECQSILTDVSDSWGNGLTWERYLTAATYVSSRAFPSTILSPNPSLIATPETKSILIPGVDALNHKRAQPVSWSVTYPDKSKGVTSQTLGPTISLISHTTTSIGEEIFNNYGPKPNSSLILGYGFSLPANPDDTILLKVSGFEKAWELGRSAMGIEGLWEELYEVMNGGEGEEAEEYWIEMDTAEMLGSMLNGCLLNLPSEEIYRQNQDLRPEVVTMLCNYIAGQREILRSLLNFCKVKEKMAKELARRQGVELIIVD